MTTKERGPLPLSHRRRVRRRGEGEGPWRQWWRNLGEEA
jgi:hypothetical protein